MESSRHSTKAVIAYNTLFQLLGKGISVGTVFIVTILIARAYGASGFGDYIKITSFVSFFFIFTDFGMNAVSIQSDEIKHPWDQLFGLRFLLSIFLSFVAFIILLFIPSGDAQGFTSFVRLGIAGFMPAMLFQGVITTTNAVFQKKLRYDLAAVAQIAGSFIILLATYASTIYIPNGTGILFCILASLLGSIITAGMAYGIIQRHYGSFQFIFIFLSIKKLFFRSFPLGITLVLNQIYFRTDSFVLALSRPTVEVGYYGLAFKIFEAAIVLPTFFMNTVYPIMIIKVEHLTSNNPEIFFVFFKKIFLAMTSASLVVLLCLWFFAPFFLYVRPEFSASIRALRILLISIPVFYITSLYMWLVITLKKNYILPWVYGIAMCITVISDIIFIPKYGYMAAAWVTVISEIVVFVIMTTIVYKLLYVNGTIKGKTL